MSRSTKTMKSRRALYGMGLLATLGLTGCQVDVGGQTLPSPYYLTDDVQYFPAGPEFLLTNEAAAMRARTEEAELEAGAPLAVRPGYTSPPLR